MLLQKNKTKTRDYYEKQMAVQLDTYRVWWSEWKEFCQQHDDDDTSTGISATSSTNNKKKIRRLRDYLSYTVMYVP
jgi:hypothetical protein